MLRASRWTSRQGVTSQRRRLNVMRAYYNEWDKPTAAWISALGAGCHLPSGHVDTRSIRDVRPSDLSEYDQCHFFAGIGGWPLALQLAGYGQLPCWTGSPPCQPFSVAGQQRGSGDERHLAPVWLDLIKECRPPILFGEQVADAIRHGWLDDLFDALEECGYACGAAVLPACSVGAPHIRKRLFFGAVRVADSVPAGRPEWRSQSGERQAPRRRGISGMANSDQIQRRRWPDSKECDADRTQAGWDESDRLSEPDMSVERMADTERRASERHRYEVDGAPGSVQSASRKQRFWPAVGDDVTVERVAFSACEQHDRSGSIGARWGAEHSDSGAAFRLAHTDDPRPQRRPGMPECADEQPIGPGSLESRSTDPHNSFWSGADWLGCRDGKFRPVEPGTQPLANGLPARVGRLRGYGNAIVPQVAAIFIKEFLGAAVEISSGN
ncbi:DNA cytosine methyltransferase [Acetobacter okinawensis]|uniref:DNA cytosine methyltransferase n=1 Tax=Acetobacter okinawensis TaxID=1076594 RepID=UPI0039EB14BE